MKAVSYALGFAISLPDPPFIAELAGEIEAALGVKLVLGEEVWLSGDFIGDMASLSLSLRLTVSEPEEYGPAERTALMGESAPLPGAKAEWIDIGPYMAQLLRARTGRPWEWRGGARTKSVD